MSRQGSSMPRMAVLVLAVFMAGCGQKGDLYLPEPGREAVAPPPAPGPATSPAPADEEDDAGNAAVPGAAQ